MGRLARARNIPRRARSTLAALRRLEHINLTVDQLAATVAENRRLIEESVVRTNALAAQLDHLHQVVGSADPREAVDVVEGVRDSVAALTVEVTEHLNRTSAVLSKLESGAAS